MSKYLPGWITGPRRQDNSHTAIKWYPWIVWPGLKTLKTNPQLRSDVATLLILRYKIARRSRDLKVKWIKYRRIVQGDLIEVRTTGIEKPTSMPVIVWRLLYDHQPISYTFKFSIDASPPGRMQPVLPTCIQGEKGNKHGNGVPTPIVGRLGASRESGSQESCNHHNTIL